MDEDITITGTVGNTEVNLLARRREVAPRPPAGGIALVAHTAAGSVAGNDITTPPIATTGASLLVAMVTDQGPAPALTDSKGNTWTALTLPSSPAQKGQLFYVKTPTVGSGHTFSTNVGAGAVPAVAVAAFSGTAGLAADLDTASATTGMSIQPGSGTPAHANEVIVTGMSSSGTDADSIDSGFTITDQLPLLGFAHFGIALAYLIQGAAAAVNPTWSGSASVTRTASMGSWQ